ncbi:MAG: glycosyltransferase family 2 protein [Acidobacteriota bacterium]
MTSKYNTSRTGQAVARSWSDSETLPLVSIIVVNYNGEPHLATCLGSLLKDTYPARQILVVDNASTDDSRTVLDNVSSLHSEIRVIWSSDNLGYAGGVNLGLESANGEFIAVLNMDVTVKPGWLMPLVTFLREHPETGAVNPLIALADGEHVNAAGQDVHVTGLGFNRCLDRPVESIGHMAFRISGIQGAAFLVRRALLNRIGGIDTTGFLYHEDVNLSWLLQLMGFDLYCVPDAIVCHDYSLTMYAGKLHLLERNRLAMLLAYLRWSSLVLLSPALLITEFLLWGYCLLRGWEFVRAKMVSYRWVLERWPQIQERRRLAEVVRVISDWTLLRRLRWSYAVDQIVTLGRERGDSTRQPAGGLPEEALNQYSKRGYRAGEH